MTVVPSAATAARLFITVYALALSRPVSVQQHAAPHEKHTRQAWKIHIRQTTQKMQIHRSSVNDAYDQMPLYSREGDKYAAGAVYECFRVKRPPSFVAFSLQSA